MRVKCHGTTIAIQHHLYYAHVVLQNPYAHTRLLIRLVVRSFARSVRENCHGISINSKIHADDLIIFYSISTISLPTHPPSCRFYSKCLSFVIHICYVAIVNKLNIKLIEFVRFYPAFPAYAISSYSSYVSSSLFLIR